MLEEKINLKLKVTQQSVIRMAGDGDADGAREALTICKNKISSRKNVKGYKQKFPKKRRQM